MSGPEPVLVTSGPRTHLLGPILALEAVSYKDAGVYRCSASNIGGEASAESRLVVITPLQVQVTPSVLSVHIGGTAEFKCNVRSEVSFRPLHLLRSFYFFCLPRIEGELSRGLDKMKPGNEDFLRDRIREFDERFSIPSRDNTTNHT